VSRANMPAFPTAFSNEGDINVSAPNGEVVAPGCAILMHGITLREYFAAMAAQGLLASRTNHADASRIDANEIARTAAKQADALLAQLSQVSP
jgi:hypothetical protein